MPATLSDHTLAKCTLFRGMNAAERQELQSLLDGKVYMPTPRGLWVLAAGKQLKVLARVNLGAKVYASPVVADGTLYIATSAGWLWAVRQGL